MIAPITSRAPGWPFDVVLPKNCTRQGGVLIDQSRSIDVATRHVRYAGRATEAVMDEALGERGAIVSTGRQK